MSADNVRGWEIVREMIICPKNDYLAEKRSFEGKYEGGEIFKARLKWCWQPLQTDDKKTFTHQNSDKIVVWCEMRKYILTRTDPFNCSC